jgi:hypothetical protein
MNAPHSTFESYLSFSLRLGPKAGRGVFHGIATG